MNQTKSDSKLFLFYFYIIPLAKKLKECGCFGVSCDEYLNYALANHKEWERKGKAIVAGYIGVYEDNDNNKKEPLVEAAWFMCNCVFVWWAWDQGGNDLPGT